MAHHINDHSKEVATFLAERERLTSLAQSYVKSRAIAEELVQDSWLRWHGKSYKASEAKPVFRQIVVNLARDWWRRAQSEKAALEALAVVDETSPSTDRAIIAKQDLARVVATLETFTPQTLAAFRMSWYEGMSLSKIGQRLGVSKSRAHKLVSKALTELALCLDP